MIQTFCKYALYALVLECNTFTEIVLRNAYGLCIFVIVQLIKNVIFIDTSVCRVNGRRSIFFRMLPELEF